MGNPHVKFTQREARVMLEALRDFQDNEYPDGEGPAELYTSIGKLDMVTHELEKEGTDTCKGDSEHG